jgi:ribosome biogenesis GTPase / thiamine phosphate phosphatase
LLLTDLGWGEPFASAFAALDPRAGAPARVVAVHRGRLTVRDATGARPARLAGRLAEPITVGDWAAVDGDDVVRARPARARVLARGGQELAANVDVAFVVTSPNRDLNARRLERFVAVAAAGGLETVLVLNKADLVTDPGGAVAILRGAAPGRAVVVASATRGDGLQELLAHLGRGRTGALIGSSGVGKSTLVNALLGAARQATRPVRPSDDRGRHTTSHRELLVLPGGRGLLVDTPGMRLPRMTADPDGVAAAFADVEALAADCRFADCRHDREPGCAVRAAVDSGTLDPARLRHRRTLEAERSGARR